MVVIVASAEGGGHVTAAVCFSFSEQIISKSYEGILMKLHI